MRAAATAVEREPARWRIFVVVLLVIAYALLWAPDAWRLFGHPLGEIGVSVDPSGSVSAVEPNARRAGVRVGDVIDWQRMSPSDRITLSVAQRTLAPGALVTIFLKRAGRDVRADVVTTPEPADSIRAAALRLVFTILFIALGMLVLLRRTSPATWAFFIFALNAAAPPSNVVDLFGPVWYRAIANELSIGLAAAMPWAIVIFALLLLREGPLPTWRRLMLVVTSVCILAVFLTEIANIVTAWLGTPCAISAWTYQILEVLPFLVAACVLVATSVESPPEIRQRLRWVIAGMVCATVAYGVAFGSTQFGLGLYPLTYAQYSLALMVAALAVGSTVAYAILKHRIIDVNVAISRALVYTLISAIVVGLFALVELFFARTFSQGKAGLFADIGLALILGFFFNAMHAQVDQFVDGLLFRSRHLAERHLATVAHSMPYAKSPEHVERLLIEEPTKALDLSCARLVPAADGRVNCGLENADSLVAYLEAEHSALHLSEHGYSCDWSLALGVFAHKQTVAIAFYGSHRDATELDGDEIALLERLTEAAGSAYERLEAEALRARLAVLEAQLGQRGIA